jgi:hypothetical protein
VLRAAARPLKSGGGSRRVCTTAMLELTLPMHVRIELVIKIQKSLGYADTGHTLDLSHRVFDGSAVYLPSVVD